MTYAKARGSNHGQFNIADGNKVQEEMKELTGIYRMLNYYRSYVVMKSSVFSNVLTYYLIKECETL